MLLLHEEEKILSNFVKKKGLFCAFQNAGKRLLNFQKLNRMTFPEFHHINSISEEGKYQKCTLYTNCNGHFSHNFDLLKEIVGTCDCVCALQVGGKLLR